MGKLFHLPFKPIHFYKNIPYLWLGIKSFYLRGKNGWSPYDTWNMDCYLLTVLPEMLRHLGTYTVGFPAPINIMDDKSYDERVKDWQKKLLYIADCFDEANEENMPKCEEFKNIKKYSNDYINNFVKIQEYRDKKKNEGFDLLKENFWNLWD